MLKCGWRSISVSNSLAGRRGFVVVVCWNRVIIRGGTRKDPPMLPAGVDYFELEMKEDEFARPRSVDAQLVQTPVGCSVVV